MADSLPLQSLAATAALGAAVAPGLATMQVTGTTPPPMQAVTVPADKPNVDWDFISAREGALKTKGYVPSDKSTGKALDNSGVTISTGVDLGAWSPESFRSLGISENLVNKLNPYFGLKGKNAQAVAGNLSISKEEAKELYSTIKNNSLKKLQNAFNKESKVPFVKLSPGQQTALASIAFQYGLGEGGNGKGLMSHNFWKQTTSGKWDEAKKNLMNYGDKYGPRRKLEASLLK